MLGKTVYVPTTINVDRFEITMENQPKGMYLLLLNDGKQVISKKIIVE